MDEEVLDTGVYCTNCGYLEYPSDIEGDKCNACGCSREAHVACKVVVDNDPDEVEEVLFSD